MPLTWNIRAVDNYEEIAVEGRESVITESLVMFSMVIESGGITEQNVGDWFAAVALYETLYGALSHEGGKPAPLTVEDVRRRVGLRTNAGGLGSAGIKKHAKRLAMDFYQSQLRVAERADA